MEAESRTNRYKSFLWSDYSGKIRANPAIFDVARELLNAGEHFMLIGEHKHNPSQVTAKSVEEKLRCAWRTRAYPVPTPSRSGFRWKASALRGLRRWVNGPAAIRPVTVMVPALYNYLPAETMAMGWLNEIDALGTIRHRINCAAKVVGWDVFTFHTLHNLDRFYDTNISAVSDTWVKEGNLSVSAVQATRQKFGKAYDYHRLQGRLVENLVFQSSILEWFSNRAVHLPLRYHVIGTGLLSALVSSGAMSFVSAVRSAFMIGQRWDAGLQSLAEAEAAKRGLKGTPDEIGWLRFEQVRNLIEGRSHLSLGVAREDMASVQAPAAAFWYSATATDTPVLIETSRDAAYALETMNIASWRSALPDAPKEPVCGWLVSPLHPLARACRWTVSNYLLATPSAALLFLDHIATLGCGSVFGDEPEPAQNRLRLSRIKVTGP